MGGLELLGYFVLLMVLLNISILLFLHLIEALKSSTMNQQR